MKGIMTEAEEFYKEYYPALVKYLCTLTGDMKISEDIAEDTFLKVFTSPGKYDEKCSVFSFLCTVGKNLYIDSLRKKRKEKSFDDMSCDFPDKSNSFDNIEKKEISEKLLTYLDETDSIQKDIFLMRIYEELSYAEIGKILGKSENYARVIFYRTKNKLIEKLKEDGYEL